MHLEDIAVDTCPSRDPCKFQAHLGFRDSRGKRRRRTVSFGRKSSADALNDYPHHRDAFRRDEYLRRHVRREDWSPSGAATRGFWARWFLWSHRGAPAILAHIRRLLRAPVRLTPRAERQLSAPYRRTAS
jgi:hypothetical protein